MGRNLRVTILLLMALLPLSARPMELAELLMKVGITGAPTTAELTGATAERIVQLTKAQGKLNATAEVLAPLPTSVETCRLMRVRFQLEKVATKDGGTTPFTEALYMPWCPSQAGYQALGSNAKGLIRVEP